MSAIIDNTLAIRSINILPQTSESSEQKASETAIEQNDDHLCASIDTNLTDASNIANPVLLKVLQQQLLALNSDLQSTDNVAIKAAAQNLTNLDLRATPNARGIQQDFINQVLANMTVVTNEIQAHLIEQAKKNDLAALMEEIQNRIKENGNLNGIGVTMLDLSSLTEQEILDELNKFGIIGTFSPAVLNISFPAGVDMNGLLNDLEANASTLLNGDPLKEAEIKYKISQRDNYAKMASNLIENMMAAINKLIRDIG